MNVPVPILPKALSPSTMTQVIPAIIPENREQLENEINLVSDFASLVQVDIADGIFTKVKTWPYNGRDMEFFEQLKTEEVGWPKWQEVDVEAHLMVEHPEDVVSDWIQTGATSIVAHIEATENFQKIIDICKENIVAVGVAIKPSTDISLLEIYASQVDFIQVMGSDNLGMHGVELQYEAVEMIRKLHALYPERIIGIDIGVNEETVEDLVEAGATRLVAGSFILEAESPAAAFNYLKSNDTKSDR